MVTKLPFVLYSYPFRSVLAKIHMVTKLQFIDKANGISSVLAKIHMVTKPSAQA